MIFAKGLRRYLCTLPLVDLLILLYLKFWETLPDFGQPVFILLMLPGGLFLVGMIAGAVWGGISGLRWWMVAVFSLASVVICPLQYEFFGDPELFWWMFGWFGGQQGIGFLVGAWCRVDFVREKERRSREAASRQDADAQSVCRNGQTAQEDEVRRWFS